MLDDRGGFDRLGYDLLWLLPLGYDVAPAVGVLVFWCSSAQMFQEGFFFPHRGDGKNVVHVSFEKDGGIGETREYCTQKNVQFRTLLMAYSAPAHPQYISDMNPDAEVVHLPPNTTALIRQVEQSAIAAFKAYYLRQTSEQALEATESGRTLRKFWKGFSILNAIRMAVLHGKKSYSDA
ncbi:hypothetical protein M514_20886 [Trichuris suis]|uniref:DDE-1 domain-containing protein n=1 Tax=Trichuris suis TaxID=68888 RepID=A0A085NC24_9BILA|nr:hypothetical protein M514_20886 [Trichuris suis]